jgi:hypothetical protein
MTDQNSTCDGILYLSPQALQNPYKNQDTWQHAVARSLQALNLEIFIPASNSEEVGDGVAAAIWAIYYRRKADLAVFYFDGSDQDVATVKELEAAGLYGILPLVVICDPKHTAYGFVKAELVAIAAVNQDPEDLPLPLYSTLDDALEPIKARMLDVASTRTVGS